MEKFDPALFLAMTSALRTVQAPRGLSERVVLVSDRLPDDLKESGINAFAPMVQTFNALGLRASSATLKRYLELLNAEGSTVGQLIKIADELEGRVIDEMREGHYYSLAPSEAYRFDHWERGWEKIIGRFCEIARDVEEMNKCFALGRYTASMFHALHVAEWGAIDLGNYIGVTDPKKGWGATERKLKELIKGGYPNLPTSIAVEFEFLEQMSREIDSMVLAWRHKVDHAANHLAIIPNTDFTPDIAEHIIGAVRIFMQRLFEGIPEAI